MFNHTFLAQLRAAEIESVVPFLPPVGARILELGAGNGQQALELLDRGYEVHAIDVEASNYRHAQVFPVSEYDGSTIPFPDHSFDVVYSSNVLEHIPDQARAFSEIRRVLKPGGYAVHVVPSGSWRLWTTLSAFAAGPQMALAAAKQRRFGRAVLCLGSPLAQRRHGERGNVFSETWQFSAASWRALFEQSSFSVVVEAPLGLFYTGNMVLGDRLSMARRERLAAKLGSACFLYRVEPT